MSDKRKESDSSPQREAEIIIREQLPKHLKWSGTLEPVKLRYGEKSYMEFDCYGQNDKTILLAEIYARQGKLKSGQERKVAKDILKLYAQSELYKQAGMSVRTAFIFTNEEAAKYLEGASWVAAVAKKFGIEISRFNLDAMQTKVLLEAQQDQNFYKIKLQ
jgi:hypothetical protein